MGDENRKKSAHTLYTLYKVLLATPRTLDKPWALAYFPPILSTPLEVAGRHEVNNFKALGQYPGTDHN